MAKMPSETRPSRPSPFVVLQLISVCVSWGRVLAATGSVPLSAPLDPTRVNVSFVPTDGTPVLPLLVNGEPENVDEVRAKEILSAEDLEVRVGLGLGSESAKYWTCDFSYVSSLCRLNTTRRVLLMCMGYTGIRQDQRRLSELSKSKRAVTY